MGVAAMSKDQFIKLVMKEKGYSSDQAEQWFQRQVDNGKLRVKDSKVQYSVETRTTYIWVNWERLVNQLIIAAIIVVGLWALWRRLL